MKTTFKAVKKVLPGGLFNPGLHLATITAIVEASAKASENWSDLTPQLEVTMKNAEGSIKQWFNLQGYKNQEDTPKAPAGFEFRSSEGGDEKYLVNKKTGERVVSEEKTELAIKIFSEFACDAGVAEGDEFSVEDLIDAEIGVMVKDNGRKGVEVHYTKPASQVTITEEA